MKKKEIVEEFTKEIMTNEKSSIISGIGIFGSVSRSSDFDIQNKDIDYKTDIDLFVLLDGINPDLIKYIFRLRTKYNKLYNEELDITLFDINVITYVCSISPVTQILFLKLFEKIMWINKNKIVDDKISEFRNNIYNKSDLQELYNKYSELGAYYALAKDMMNTIKKNALLDKYDADV